MGDKHTGIPTFVNEKTFQGFIDQKAIYKKDLETLNQNMVKLTGLLKTFMQEQAQSQGHTIVSQSTSKSKNVDEATVLQLKNVTFPKFKGEERERNKDMVQIFL